MKFILIALIVLGIGLVIWGFTHENLLIAAPGSMMMVIGAYRLGGEDD